MKKYIETGLMILCTAGLFGFIYPQLCLTTDTVKVIECDEVQDSDIKSISGIYNDRHTLTPIRVRFRVLELLK